MKTLRLILILIILISSCKNSNYKKELNCDYIEISYDNGWTGGSAIKINKDLTYKKCYYHIISDVDSCSCFVDTLTAGEYLGRINIMVDSLKNSKIDSIYDGNCQDCGAYIIRIKYPDKMIKTMIIGAHKFDTRISRFAWFVSEMPISKNHPDSCEIFETTRIMIPPKIEVKRKFLPPTIEEMN